MTITHAEKGRSHVHASDNISHNKELGRGLLSFGFGFRVESRLGLGVGLALGLWLDLTKDCWYM